MPVDLELQKDEDGYYTIVSLMPHGNKIKGALLFDGEANPSTDTADGTQSSVANNKGGVARRATKQVRFPRRGNNDKEGGIGHGCDLPILRSRIGI